MSNANKELYEFENFRLDVSERILWREDEKIPLSEKAFETLCALVRRGNRLVSKDELLNEIWAGAFVEENNLDKNISILRNVLGERAGRGKFVETVRGHGFRFVADVRRISEDEKIISFLPESDNTEVKFQGENQSQTKNLKTQNEFETKEPVKTANRNLTLFAVISVLIISAFALAFYFWKSAENPVAGTKIRTIAVLPFKPLVAENRNESLELGMADTLIAKLSGGEIVVRPINAVRKFNNLEQNSLAAGRELGSDAVLDGTIQTAGDRIRISAKLLRTSDGKSLWTGQFDEKFTDIFTVQDSISEKVLAALSLTLNSNERKRDTQNVEAYQLYMKGRFHHYKLNYDEAQKGIEYYRQAIALDPNYSLAYAGIADAYRSFSLTSDVDPNDAMPKAKAAAMKAIELDEKLSDAHTALGFILFFYDWDWQNAEKEYKRALELNPNSADAHQAYAHLLSNLGRHQEALAEIRRAKEIEPLNLRTNALEGQFLLHAGQLDAAIENIQKTIELEPNFWMTHLFAASAYAEKGLFDRAFSEGAEAKKFSPTQNWSIAFGAYALARNGKTTEARAVLDELSKISKTSYVPPYHLALICNGLGESEKALDYLEKGFAEKDVHLVFLKVEPKWNNLRNEPRFVELIKRMNF